MVKRKWALILGIIFLIYTLIKLFTGTANSSDMPSEYNTGQLIFLIFLPALFFVVAFLPKKEK